MEKGDLGPSDDEIVSFKQEEGIIKVESELNKNKMMPSMARAETSDGIPKYQEYTRTSILVPKISEENNNHNKRRDSLPNHYNVEQNESCTFSKIYYHPGMMGFSLLIISGLMIASFIMAEFEGNTIWTITGFCFLGLLVLYLLSLIYYGYKSYKIRKENQNKWSPKLASNHDDDVENGDGGDDDIE